MRNRGSVILIEDNRIVLIKRVRKGTVYYVFPGGGIEEGEAPKDAAKREAFEELGVVVNVNECLAKAEWNGNQYFFSAEIVNGSIGSGQGEEYTNNTRNRGTYQPMWVDINQMSILDVRPKEVAEKILHIFK